MKMRKLVVGKLQTNCYILYEDKKCLIIDPGDEANSIIKEITKLKLTPLAILLTHNHFDHTGAVPELKEIYKIPVFDHKNLFEELKVISPFQFKTIYTPGHSSSSITFYFEEYDIMFCGDFIFYENIGRVDLPSGSYSDMIQSINKIKTYDEDIILYPGHGKETTLKHELKYNHYFI